ncbi:MAG: murein biosynthesis integral membrane protein MurJ [Candidatus Dadabacteria bacterium]|nr:murein biosynthesis integral membrane protein MurJ [Candidatus Dadabacteria bacterium]
MKDKRSFARSAGLIGSLTFLSRITGYARDVVMAYFFGATAFTDAFWIAFRIPNLLRRLFAEGSLTISFIPVFTDTLENKSREEAKKVSDVVFTILIVSVSVISVLGIVFSPYIVKLFAYGFDEPTFELAVGLNRIMFPYIFFISLTALAMGVLNSLRKFFAPAFSPILLNAAMIGTIFLLYNRYELPIYAAAVGVIIGGALQLAIQLPYLKAKGFLFSFSTNLRNPAVKRIGLLIVPQLFGMAVYNLNLLVSSQYASFMQEGTVSYLYFAERLIEFPLGIIAVSIATVLLPSLSSYASRGDYDNFHGTYTFTLRLMLFILIPALAGLIALSLPICSVLYQRGEFTHEAAVFTSQTLVGYCFGLWAVGGLRVTAPAFYAMQDTKTPVVVAFFAFLLNAALGYILGFTLGLSHTGLALANSASSIFNFLLLIYLLERRTGELRAGPIVRFAMLVTAISAIAAAAAWKISTYADWAAPDLTLEKLLTLISSMAAAVLIYVLLAKVFRIDESRYVFAVLKRGKPPIDRA